MNFLPQRRPVLTSGFLRIESGGTPLPFMEIGASEQAPVETPTILVEQVIVEIIGETSGIQPCQVRIRDLQDPRLRLTDDLIVAIDMVDGVYTAYCHDLDDFGSGSSEAEARSDFCAAIAELYFTLKEEGEANLGPMLLANWRYLQRIVAEV